MPSSAPSLLGWLFEHVEQLRPRRVLDIGIGFGKNGFLVKEYAEKRGPHEESLCYLVGCEAFSTYITDLQRMIYDEILTGDIVAHLPQLAASEPFDLVMMTDVIEHFDKEDGERLLLDLSKLSRRLLITTPVIFAPQEAEYGNHFEIHRSHWRLSDFTLPLLDTWQRGCVFGVYLKGAVE